MKIRVLRLGITCQDKATKLRGTLTHWVIGMGRQVRYIFQPRGLDDEGQPVKKLGLEEERLKVSEDDFEEVEVPFEILGTQVTSKSSGFTGMAVKFVRHINSCFHIAIQPEGVSAKTKMAIEENDFDIRECAGDAITELSEKELKESKRETPSPTGDKTREALPRSLRDPR